MIGVFASQPHYLDHILPIVHASAIPWRIITRAEAKDVKLIVLAGYDDTRLVPEAIPYVYVEHGSGQTYEPWSHPAYSGGAGHYDCAGFICPGEEVADRWRQKYPHIPRCAAGCPKMDPWHRGDRPIPTDFTVAITFHWDCNYSKFSRWAFSHYRRELHHVVDSWREQKWIVIGHAHPRAAEMLSRFWADIGVEYVAHFSEVFDRANILIADNTSLLPEFMSLDRPVGFLNAPWYERDKEVGGRFWDWDDAAQSFWSPEVLADLDLTWLAMVDPNREARRRVVRDVYTATDGHAAERAAEFLVDIYGGL